MTRIRAFLAAGLSMALLGCSNDDGCASNPGVAADYLCTAGISYDGHFYEERRDKRPAERGKLLGKAFYPHCSDGCGAKADHPGTPTKVWRLRGANPEERLVGRSVHGHGFAVFVKRDE